MRRVGIVLTTMLFLLGATFGYPVGGSIWSAGQVTGVAILRGESLLQLQNPDLVPHVAEEVVVTARMDRFRKFLPGIPQEQCTPVDLALKTAEEWVRVELHCTSGLLFDYIDPAAWR